MFFVSGDFIGQLLAQLAGVGCDSLRQDAVRAPGPQSCPWPLSYTAAHGGGMQGKINILIQKLRIKYLWNLAVADLYNAWLTGKSP